LADEYFNLNRKVLILTDSGVPTEYSELIKSKCKDAFIYTIEQGEENKNLDNFGKILSFMAANRFTRTDCVVAVGGGVVGDLAGFVAASYMRGIDFYNLPTTLLSQIDSSIGGKVAVDFRGYKNLVGAFYQPKKVVIDPETLQTLPRRQFANGLAEAIKMAATSDEKLFCLIEECDALQSVEEIIFRSLCIKKAVVEQDEKETGLRKVLNFGHTIAHAIEANERLCNLYHGECVGLGMLAMSSGSAKARILAVLKKEGLPIDYTADKNALCEAIKHDKKMSGENITVVTVEKIGSFKFEKIPYAELCDRIREAM
jgi:3-dehydroquinate synthase